MQKLTVEQAKQLLRLLTAPYYSHFYIRAPDPEILSACPSIAQLTQSYCIIVRM